MTQHDTSKRKFIKAATYVVPAILTLKVAPTFASGGSGRYNGNPNGSGEEPSYNEGPASESVQGSNGSLPGGGGSSSSYSYSPRKKKRNWFWPFS